jgi:UDP-glucose 4-epimerase
MAVLVTGGAGFMGSHVADELLAAGHDVVVLDDLSGGFVENVPEKATFIEGSILDNELVQKLFLQYRFEHVFHLAAYAAEGLSHFIRSFNYHNNLVGSINLINASVNSNVKTFVFTSSIAVYGRNQLPMLETTTPLPEDPYGVSKYAVELDLRCAHEMFGMDFVVFRPHNVYGERQNIGDKYRNVIGIFMNQIMQGKPLTVFGDGEQTRAFSYIADVAPVIARAPFVPAARNRVFNVGADQPYTVNELAKVVSRAMGVEPNIIHLPPRNEVVHAYSNHEAAREVFKPGAPVTLEEGVGRMVEWAKKTGAKSSKMFSGIEIPRNMPPSWLKR